jgi:hypothetical protein
LATGEGGGAEMPRRFAFWGLLGGLQPTGLPLPQARDPSQRFSGSRHLAF